MDEGNLFAQGGTVEAFDHTAIIPGYTDHWNDPSDIILAAVKAGELTLLSLNRFCDTTRVL